MRLGVIYDSQATNRKQGRFPVRARLPRLPRLHGLLLIAWESYMTPSYPEYTKTASQTRWKLLLLDRKIIRNSIFLIKTFNNIEFKHIL
jgi:hypothetical protein